MARIEVVDAVMLNEQINRMKSQTMKGVSKPDPKYIAGLSYGLDTLAAIIAGNRFVTTVKEKE